jgi:hypothetical protein
MVLKATKLLYTPKAIEETAVKGKERSFWLFVAVLILIKLWLVEGQSITANPQYKYDDVLYLTQANYLINGEWLGPYNNLTLVKGPFYPMWIAFSYVLGLPLLFSEHLLYILACIVLVSAVRPLLRRGVYAYILFAVVLFNPMSYGWWIMTRVIRAGIYPALTLLVLSCAIGLTLREGQGWRKLWPWAIGLGLSMGTFWLTREEGIWLVPSILLLGGYAVFRSWRRGREGLRQGLALWSAALGLGAGIVVLVMGINWGIYGLFGVTELGTDAFKSAFGAILRVETGKSGLSVSRQTVGEIYTVSPAFKELEPYLEGPSGEFWVVASPGGLDNYSTDAIMWAFREGTAEAGHYDDNRFPREFYEQVAEEINKACEAGQLRCNAERASLSPPWHNDYLRPMAKNIYRAGLVLIGLKGFSAYPSNSIQYEETNRMFRDLTREKLFGTDRQTTIEGWAFREGSSISFRVTGRGNAEISAAVDFEPSADLYERFSAEGQEMSVTKQARFKIRTLCNEDCLLEVWSEGQMLYTWSFDQLESIKEFNDGDLWFNVDEIDKDWLLENQSSSDEVKINILGRIGKVYQLLFPAVFAIAGLTYGFLGVRLLAKRDVWAQFIVLSAFLGAVIVRIVLLAWIETTSFEAINSLYFSPVYALILAFAVLALVWGLDEVEAIIIRQRNPNQPESNLEEKQVIDES